MNILLQKALAMRQFAHAPHSHFNVGAALLTDDGTIIGGCNIESDVYGLTMCAERTAIFSAIAQGYKKFTAIAIATSTNGTPCGACRQIIAELCGNIQIYTTDLLGNHSSYLTEELLAHHFNLKTFIPNTQKSDLQTLV